MPSLRKFGVLAATAIASIQLAQPVAFAHARPKVMAPASDSTGPAPEKIQVTFSEAIEPKFSSLTLTDEAGKPVSAEKSQPVAGDAKTLVLKAPASLPSGGYLVHWISVAPDGHRMEGEYKFTVK